MDGFGYFSEIEQFDFLAVLGAGAVRKAEGLFCQIKNLKGVAFISQL